MSTYQVKVRLLHGECAGSELGVKVPASIVWRVFELEEQGLLQVLDCEYVP